MHGVPQRIMLHRLPAIILLLLPYFAHAQDTLPHDMTDHLYFGPARYENVKDSAEFARFRKGLRTVAPTLSKDTTTIRYRMVWQEDQHGGMWMVSRGDGSLLKHSVNEANDWFMGQPFRTYDGRRGVVVVHDTPCGMICRSVWYYVEE